MNRLIRITFWGAALFAFVMATLPQPVELPTSDKVQHMAAFFTITVLGRWAFPRAAWWKLALALVAFGGLIELVQLIPELHRDSEWSDWFADIVAIGAGLIVAELVQRLLGVRPE
jgi:hypothetical protein